MPRGRLKEGMSIPSLDDDVFASDKKKALDNAERVIEIKLNSISDFPNHPFKVKEDEEMLDLIESVARSGVVMPVIVRPVEDGSYQMVVGHRRKYASEKNDDEATIIMVDTNLQQRQTILPSEKAYAYKLKLDAMKRQGKRTDLTSGPVGQKLNSLEKISQEANESVKQIQRYIRLTYLRPAVEISYLTQEEQITLSYFIEENECTPSHDQTIRMRKMHDDGTLTDEAIENIMNEEKPNQVEKFRITKNRIEKFFKPKTSAKEMENEIVKALEFYQRHKNRIRNKDAR